jgi:hypothetical protein
LLELPESARRPAIDQYAQERDGAWVCELTDEVNLREWPEGTRLICRRERPHPGAQLSFSDLDGHRFQYFITDQADPHIAHLERPTGSTQSSRSVVVCLAVEADPEDERALLGDSSLQRHFEAFLDLFILRPDGEWDRADWTATTYTWFPDTYHGEIRASSRSVWCAAEPVSVEGPG